MSLTDKDRKELILHNVKKAYDSIKEAEILSEHNFFTGSLNRIYYGVFYIISALAIKNKYQTSNHSQLIGWFNKNYVRNSKVSRKIGKFIYTAFDQRMESDYDPLAEFSKDEIIQNIKNMKETIQTIEKVINSEEEST